MLNASHVKWRHLKSDLKAPMLKDEHPWHLGPGSFLQLTAYASVAELIADIIPTVPNAATMITIANIATGFIGGYIAEQGSI